MSAAEVLSSLPPWMDLELTEVFAQFGLDDFKATLRKGKNRASAPPSDLQFALSLQVEDLAAFLTSQADILFAARLGGNGAADARALEREERYRELAAALTKDDPMAMLNQSDEDEPSLKPSQAGASMMDSSSADRSAADVFDFANSSNADDDDFGPTEEEEALLRAILEMNAQDERLFSSAPDQWDDDSLPPRASTSRRRDFRAGSRTPPSSDEEDDSLFPRSQSPLFDDSRSTTSSSLNSSLPPDPADVVLPECDFCREADEKLIPLPCGQHFCDAACLTRLFSTAMSDESQFPPQCDGHPIPISLVAPHVSKTFIDDYQLKALEYTTKERLYCPKETCSRFLGAATLPNVQQRIECPSCGTAACSACKGIAHAMEDPCIDAAEEKSVVEFSLKQGWQQCKTCRRVVERTEGCPHIVCVCKAEFCYGCGEKWGPHSGCSRS